MNFGRRLFLKRAGTAAVAAPFAGQAVATAALEALPGHHQANLESLAGNIAMPIPGVPSNDVIRTAARLLLEKKEREDGLRRAYQQVYGLDHDLAALRAPAYWWRLAQQQKADHDRQSALASLRQKVWG